MEKILLIGVVAGIVSAVLPSIPTTFWMWKERPEYRWILILSWFIILCIMVFVWFKYKGGM